MTHLPHLISDLALILVAAAIASLIFKKIRQPVVLGYILAGFIVGPHFHVFPTITDLPSIQIWAEIGVIFLLFGLGLEFSFKRLAKVGSTATITALVEIFAMLGVGYLTGRAFGWSQMDSLFLGGILSISSTTIIIRAFEELNLKSRRFVSIVFGVLIVEDLVAILLLVLLSTVAVTQSFQGIELLGKSARLGFFLVLWFVSGILIVPSILKWTRKVLNDELRLILSLALCLAMVYLSAKAGFSPALGAFIMGSLLAETTEAEKIEHLVKPVRDLFAAVFFVSVGMLIDPQILITQTQPVIIITLVTIVGKLVSSTLGALCAGQSMRHSVQAGMSLAQIGEFSFIIASLGVALNVTGTFLYPIAVAVSAITTLTTPYLIKSSDRVADFVEKRLPKTWMTALTNYSSATQSPSEKKTWSKFLWARLTRIAGNSVIVIGIIWGARSYLEPFILKFISNPVLAKVILLSISITLSSPFLWAVAFGGAKSSSIRDYFQQAKSRGLLVFVEICSFLIAFFLLAFMLTSFFSIDSGIGIIACIIVLSLVLGVFRINSIYQWIESRFLSNLSERDTVDEKGKTAVSRLAPWDAHIAFFIVPAEFSGVGNTLHELKVREAFGVTIAIIERGHLKITAPHRDVRLLPYDRVGVIGNDDQLERFSRYLQEFDEAVSNEAVAHDQYVLKAIELRANAPFIGKAIRDSKLREATKGLVVGIERQGTRILNPDSSLSFEEGDIVWIVGEENDIYRLSQRLSSPTHPGL